MKLLVERHTKKPTYTIGRLYIDGEYFCDTLEDKDRGLRSDMDVDAIRVVKIAGATAIPMGVYDVRLDVVSPKYSTSAFMKKYANGGRVPRLEGVKGFDGVLIHTGNTDKDTEGCILVGVNDYAGHIGQSRETFKRLYPLLQAADEITIEIVSK